MTPGCASRRSAKSKDKVTDSPGAARGTDQTHRPPEQNPAAAKAPLEKCPPPRCILCSAPPCACIDGGWSPRELSTFPASPLRPCATVQASGPPPISAPARRYLSVRGRTLAVV